MALVHMASNTDADFPDGAYCPIKRAGDAWYDGYSGTPLGQLIEGTSRPHALVLYITHEGLCIKEREDNGRDDSDFFMTLWDWEAMAPYEVQFATTRGWCYPCLGSRADATGDVLAAYSEWMTRQMSEARAFSEAGKARAIIDGVNAPHKGATVVVKRGRKVPKGTTGVVLGLQERSAVTRGRWAAGTVREVWALVRTTQADGKEAFQNVLAKHCDVVTPDPAYVQHVFDLADAHRLPSAKAQWNYGYGFSV